MVVELLYRDVPVAFARDAFEHQGTWFAEEYSLVKGFAEHPDAARLAEFIAFSIRWHAVDGDPAEWDYFLDVVEGGSWQWRKLESIRAGQPLEGPILIVEHAPVFMAGGVSFRTARPAPAPRI